jgi:alpha-D-xyloside xylohydrolase
MMGPVILVAPVFTGQNERTVVLPNGNWFDFYTGEYVGNGEIITIKTKLDRIPLFAKDGAIVPMLSSANKNESGQSLEIRHYGTKENTFLLYNDDGETFNYEKGEYTITELKVEKRENGKLTGNSKPLNDDMFSYGTLTWHWMTK